MKRIYVLFSLVVLTSMSSVVFAQDAGAGAQGADELAKEVVAATGDPSALDELAFTFVVEKGGKELVRRRHIWRPQAGELTVKSGEQTIELTHLHDYDLSKLAGDPAANADAFKKIAPNASPAEAAKAWGWFINDSYWLLAPSKLMDPGVHRKLDDEGRLVLTFGEVGLTPGDRYALTIDRDTKRVTRWDFKLQSGREGHFAWTGYKKVGPLTLSTKRPADGGDVVIRFENLDAVASASAGSNGPMQR